MSIFPRRGEIYWVKLDPAIGTETKKTRSSLIVSNDVGNEVSSRVIVAPITSKTNKVYPFEAEIEFNQKQCKVMLDQIRVIDKRRLGGKIIELSNTEMKDVNASLKLVLGLD